MALDKEQASSSGSCESYDRASCCYNKSQSAVMAKITKPALTSFQSLFVLCLVAIPTQIWQIHSLITTQRLVILNSNGIRINPQSIIIYIYIYIKIHLSCSPGDSRSARTPSSRCLVPSPRAPPPPCSDPWPSCSPHLSDLQTGNQQRENPSVGCKLIVQQMGMWVQTWWPISVC